MLNKEHDDAVDALSYTLSWWPKNTWRWDSGNGLTFCFTGKVSIWKRFWVRVFFGGKWVKL